MYQVASSKAEEFIHDGEIVETLAYARENRANRPLIEAILQKAAEGKGVTHREAAVLLECELEDLNQRMFTLAKQIKEKLYGNRIVMFAPLYLSNYCINGCVYCPYHQKNKTIPRRKLTQEEIRVWHSKPERTRATIRSSTFSNRSRPSTPYITRTERFAA